LHLRVCSEIENVLKMVIHKDFMDESEILKLWKVKKWSSLDQESESEFRKILLKKNSRDTISLESEVFGSRPDYAFYFNLANEKINLNQKKIQYLKSLEYIKKIHEFKPFKNNSSAVPLWWTNYNKLKHDKVTNYKQCDLESLIFSLGGLYLLVNYLLFHQIGNHRIQSFYRNEVSCTGEGEKLGLQSNLFCLSRHVQLPGFKNDLNGFCGDNRAWDV
jgi:hypothetical protein